MSTVADRRDAVDQFEIGGRWEPIPVAGGQDQISSEVWRSRWIWFWIEFVAVVGSVSPPDPRSSRHELLSLRVPAYLVM